jgi:Domain of Unknown Function (DUF1206)
MCPLRNTRVVAHPIDNLRRLVREGPSDAPGRVVDALGRIGLVGYGVVHLLVAWLALQVAFGVPDRAPDAQGAVGTIAGRQPVAPVASPCSGWLAPALQCAIEIVGAVGHLARALTLAVVGVLAAAAALHADPGWAGGLDVALRALGSTALGSTLLVGVATGFAAFGLFCFADAATRRA